MNALAIATIGMVLGPHGAGTKAPRCDALARLALPDTRILRAEVVRGRFGLPTAQDTAMARRFGVPLVITNLPTFCRVVAEIRPTADSDIGIEVWMPAAGWNGILEGIGTGGWGGGIDHRALADAVRRGYAAAFTDTGHRGYLVDASFALGHPEKLIDFGYRAVHEMTLAARALVAAFYGRPPERAYWRGCSGGGRQGLMEAQRFPLDYDAIVAGAPANYMTHLLAGDVWAAQATHASPAAYIPAAGFALLHRAALAACDAQDGVKDGVIGDPSRCSFDPGVLLCKGAATAACLTASQVEVARKIYAGAKNPRTGVQIFPGREPGSEMQWMMMEGPPNLNPIAASYFKYVVFRDTTWDFRTMNFDGDVARGDSLDAGILNATDPDLTPFISHGGKLLLFHGWSDPAIAPANTVHYYESVVQRLGRDRTRNAVRLFMVPGMQHCGGGAGTDHFDALAALDRWVATGKAPDRILASHLSGSKVDRTRPLCAYPRVARYIGHGSTDEAANFACTAPGGQ